MEPSAALLYQIHHIFLPQKLPDSDDASATNELALIKTVLDALARFKSHSGAVRTPGLDHCIQMLRCMVNLAEAMEFHFEPSPAAMAAFAGTVGQQVTDLRDSGCLAVYVCRQNAGLLVTRIGTDMHFELVEAAPDDIAMRCEGRLRRCFPTSTVALARSEVVSPEFQQSFLTVLAQLALTPPASIEKGGQKLLSQLFMGALRGTGHSVTDGVSYICKCSREEVTHKDLEKTAEYDPQRWLSPWRRSPLWLLIRVALHLTLDRAGDQEGWDHHRHGDRYSLYKAFMVTLLSFVLERAAQASVPHHILFFMKAKINQRVLKLGSVEGEGWYRVSHEVMQRVDSMLTTNWDSIQSAKRQTLDLSALSTLDFGRDTHLTFETLRSHLARPRQKDVAEYMHAEGDKIHGFQFRRVQPYEWPSETFRRDRDIVFFDLADFEQWVESRTERYMSPGSSALTNPNIPAVPADMAYLGSLAPCFTISAAGEGRTPKRRRDPPKHNSSPSRESEWSRSVDNVFARRFLAWRKTPRDHLSTERRQAPSRLCGECESLPLLEPGFELFLNRSLLRKKLGHCELCKIFYHALWPSAAPLRSVWPVRLYRDGTNLVADGYDKPLLRICVDSDWAGDSTVQVGPRAFPERSSPAYFELLLEWLRDCDINHEDIGCHMRSRESWLPTRIIDVGDKNEAEGGILRLVHTRMWWWSRSRYVALSHRWGRRSSKDNARNCTLISNLEDHCQSIKFDELGRTFQDAITVTRQLGQRYLWIDSLCIVQDDKDDCNREIKCMEQVFASAYCVIAAASAEGTDAGFLGPRPPNQSVSVLTSSSETPLYICQSIDDFRGEVEGAGLSRRGWVLQERALARRTIFFGSGQTYWECGVGIRSEGMAFLTNQAASFLGDPRFPEMVTRGNLEDQRQVFQTVFKMYSNLELTYATDRPRAIAGIERRLASVMGSSVAFGVFSGSGCLHHSLLWRRVGDTLLQQINSSTFFVPTWSWMAFDGAIDYLDVAPAGVIWNTHISFVSSMAEVHTELGVPVVAFNLDNMSRDLELLILDGQHTADVRNLGCVIVGRRELPQGQEDEYYILVVSPAPAGRTNIEYQRLGVAIVQKVHIAIEWGSWHGRLI